MRWTGTSFICIYLWYFTGNILLMRGLHTCSNLARLQVLWTTPTNSSTKQNSKYLASMCWLFLELWHQDSQVLGHRGLGWCAHEQNICLVCWSEGVALRSLVAKLPLTFTPSFWRVKSHHTGHGFLLSSYCSDLLQGNLFSQALRPPPPPTSRQCGSTGQVMLVWIIISV